MLSKNTTIEHTMPRFAQTGLRQTSGLFLASHANRIKGLAEVHFFGEWAQYSPDMNPLDFCIFGILKNRVYRTDVPHGILACVKKILKMLLTCFKQTYNGKIVPVVWQKWAGH